jgi:L,D-transpeptidase catalytic domain
MPGNAQLNRVFLKMKLRVLFSTFLIAISAVPAFAARIDITINKVSQKMIVQIDGEVEYVWPVSTGAGGYDTPSGKFKAFRLEEDHKSTEWDDAPMPHSIFFTPRGHAIHGSYSKRIGQRASHGCVRLNPENAEVLFGIVEDNGLGNTFVVVKGGFFDGGGSSANFWGSRQSPVKAFRQSALGVKARVQGRSPWATLFGPQPVVKRKPTIKAKKVVKKPAKKPLVVGSSN